MARLFILLLWAALSGQLTGQEPPQVLWEDDGLSAYYQLGWNVGWVDDVDGDEASEFVASAPGSRKVHMYSGMTRERLHTVSGGTMYGYSMTSLGDVDGDGFADFAAGTPFDNSNTGVVDVISGLDFSVIYTLTGNAAGDYFGWNLASAGDTDGDGVQDLMILCRTGNGAVKIHSGIDGQLRYSIGGRSASDQFGEAMTGIHDYDGDGFDDFLIGAPDYPNGGLATLYSGWNGLEISSLSYSSGEGFGAALAQLGDLNDDGIPEFAVGAPETQKFTISRAGEIRIYDGSDLSLINFRNGTTRWQRLGSHIADAGDYDLDGYSDYYVSSPGADAGVKTRAGRVELISGANFSVIGSSPGWIQFGEYPSSIAGGGDGHKDLIPDGLIGYTEGGSKLHGRIQLFGNPSPWLQASNLVAGATATLTASGCQAGSRVQFWASRAGNGPTQVPGGTVLLNFPAHKVGYAIVPINGTAELDVAIPNALAGLWIHAQALEIKPGGELRLSSGLSSVVQ